MKSSITKITLKAIYRLLDRVSPLDQDCGQLCGAACCTCGSEINFPDSKGEDDFGIYLLPGEEKMFSRKEDWLGWEKNHAEDYEFPDSWHGTVYFLHCKTAPCCPRENRPLQCRFFPLAPHLDEDDVLHMVYQDSELPYECPLISQEIPLNEDFIRATYTVWKHLIQDPLLYDLVVMDSDFRIEDLGDEIEYLYP